MPKTTRGNSTTSPRGSNEPLDLAQKFEYLDPKFCLKPSKINLKYDHLSTIFTILLQ